jgi:hypothetical protein
LQTMPCFSDSYRAVVESIPPDRAITAFGFIGTPVWTVGKKKAGGGH